MSQRSLCGGHGWKFIRKKSGGNGSEQSPGLGIALPRTVRLPLPRIYLKVLRSRKPSFLLLIRFLDTVLIPGHAGPSTTTSPPATRPVADTSTVLPPGIRPTPSGTALRNSLRDNGDNLPEIPQIAASDQNARTREQLGDGSLWDRAYDVLQNEEPERVAAYKDLLSKAIAGGQFFYLGWICLPRC